MNRTTALVLFCTCSILLGVLGGTAGCRTGGEKSGVSGITLGEGGATAESFIRYYSPAPRDFVVRMPSYELPLDLDIVGNLRQAGGASLGIPAPVSTDGTLLGSPAAIDGLRANGFVVVRSPGLDRLDELYEMLTGRDLPLYITADTPLHLFHIQFDETLREIEEGVFYGDIVLVTESLLEASEADYREFEGPVKEAARRNVAFFSVARKLFEPGFSPPALVASQVEWELGKITEHEGFVDFRTARERALFRVPEDYSQYKPRGHYTRSEVLERYFRGMMWYGRMTFLLKGHERFGPVVAGSGAAEALTDPETAMIQTVQASLIASHCGGLELADGRTVLEVWDRIYGVTAFYAGFADDLTLYDYREELRELFGGSVEPADLVGGEPFERLVRGLASRRGPAIFSGTGGAAVDTGDESYHERISAEQLDEILAATMGMRFMGQRYIPDSYILGQLVSPAAGTVPRRIPERFTVVYIPDDRLPSGVMSIRGFPMGLDVFSVLGSERAARHVAAGTDNEYPRYAAQVERLRGEFAGVDEQGWNRNLYWSWLYALKALTAERGAGYQAYQRTEAWLDRQLATALGSWAALRHDTILYGKQSYTPMVRATSVEVAPPPPKGLVEPVPVFYARILATARMAHEGLRDLGVLSRPAEGRLRTLVSILERLDDICRRQTANEPLTEADDRFLAGFAKALEGTIGDVEEEGLVTTLVADVHTEGNSQMVLQEASGHLDLVFVAYERPAGDIVLAVGPVLSYYEFKQPMSDRLTDEQWREMLRSGEAPRRPAWTSSYLVE